MAHFAYVDALRGLAFLMVLTVHGSIAADLRESGLEGVLLRFCGRGMYGVQLFYLISALTLAHAMDSRAGRDLHPTGAFFARRVFRIAPLFWLAIGFYAWWYGLGPRYYAPGGLSTADIVATALFAHGWYPTTINSVVPGGWTIGVEMAFYLTLPPLHRWAGTPGRVVALLAGSLAVALVADRAHLAGRLYPAWRAADPGLTADFGYYWLPNQLPVFVLGLLLYHLTGATHRNVDGAVRVQPGPLGWSLAGLVVALFVATYREFPPHILYASLFFLLSWGLSISPTTILVNRLTRHLGKLSFSAYLAHLAALNIGSRLLGLERSQALFRSEICNRLVPVLVHAGTWPGPVRFAALMAIVLAITLIVATATYRWIERPFIGLGARLIRQGPKRPVDPNSAEGPSSPDVGANPAALSATTRP